jgi:hypothetical protein
MEEKKMGSLLSASLWAMRPVRGFRSAEIMHGEIAYCVSCLYVSGSRKSPIICISHRCRSADAMARMWGME